MRFKDYEKVSICIMLFLFDFFCVEFFDRFIEIKNKMKVLKFRLISW